MEGGESLLRDLEVFVVESGVDQMNKKVQGKTRYLLLAGVLVGASTAQADISADFTINGQNLEGLMDPSGHVAADASDWLELDYSGGSRACSRVAWSYRLDGGEQWQTLDSGLSSSLILHREGEHELRMTVEGRNNLWAWCFQSGAYDERTVTLSIDEAGYAQTRYPIMLVPGVIGFDDIFGIEYFYRIEREIQAHSDQPTRTASLNPWMETEQRGRELRDEIIDFLAETGAEKVNLIAHSHGSTTARVAIAELAEHDADAIASLTTVAGPHYGTPTADGANWAMEEWGTLGDLLAGTLIPGFEFLGDVVAFLSGYSESFGEEDMNLLEVLSDFTQEEMYHFNHKYPTVALPPGGRYHFMANRKLDPSVHVEDPTQAYGVAEDEYEDYLAHACRDHGLTLHEQDESHCVVVGNGLGEFRTPDQPDAIQFYSLSGHAPASTNWLDPADLALALFHSFHGTVQKAENSWALIIPHHDPEHENGFVAADGFIPVDSARFGKYIDTFYWNHVDQQNGLLGLLASEDDDGEAVADPKQVYLSHANRLRNAGL